MNIQDLSNRIKSFINPSAVNNSEVFEFDQNGQVRDKGLFSKLFLSLVIILVATLSFGLGKLSVAGDKEPVRIELDQSLINSENRVSNQNTANTASAVQALSQGTHEVVASSKGSKYHYPHCSGAKQISEKNKITFSTAKDAEAAGYTLAANCKPR